MTDPFVATLDKLTSGKKEVDFRFKFVLFCTFLNYLKSKFQKEVLVAQSKMSNFLLKSKYNAAIIPVPDICFCVVTSISLKNTHPDPVSCQAAVTPQPAWAEAAQPRTDH